ncbi:MAG: TRAP transporter substrate-binding protein [Alphaproteobacteria bacterium]|nr:TRAP transporter substrate-binding protein [Alphaproteobacteria bacterium]
MAVTNRRKFLKTAGVAGAGAAAAVGVAAPAIAQSMPEVKWRLTSSFPKALDTIFGAGDVFAKRVAEATDNKFQIQVFAANEIVPGLQAADAVTNGSVEIAHTASYYYVGKDPTFAFGTAVPFGLNARQQNAWFYIGDGMKVLNAFYKKHNIHAIPGGNTGAQMGGWYRKEIKSVADINGLKMRIGGFAGRVLSKLGASPQQIAGGEIYQALETGTIDAAEWVGPYDDEKLGFQKVAKYYYFPGWWEGGAALHFFINTAKWEGLPKVYKAIVEAAAAEANGWMLAKYDEVNPAALKRVVAGGAELRAFPNDVMEACYKAANELYAETMKTNADFKTVHDSMMAYRKDAYQWFQLTEYTFDTFMMIQQRKGTL